MSEVNRLSEKVSNPKKVSRQEQVVEKGSTQPQVPPEEAKKLYVKQLFKETADKLEQKVRNTKGKATVLMAGGRVALKARYDPSRDRVFFTIAINLGRFIRTAKGNIPVSVNLTLPSDVEGLIAAAKFAETHRDAILEVLNRNTRREEIEEIEGLEDVIWL